MLSVGVFNMQGQRVGQMDIDPEVLGGHVRPRLMKLAVVAFLDHQRQFSARTKGRSHTEGSTRKLYRQKGTGNARAGSIRTPVRRGGGRAFPKRVPAANKALPKMMRRLARNSAILSKIEAQEVMVLDGLKCAAPKTKPIATMFAALGVDRGCLLALDARDDNVVRSTRNIADTDVRLIDDLTTYDVLRRRKLIFTKSAFMRLSEIAAGPQGKGSKE